MFKRQRYEPGPDDHTPLVAIWYQTREAIADLIIPVLAGLKTLWLLLAAPRVFFHAVFFRERPLAKLHSPLGPFWRTLTKEPQEPLKAAQFLLFGILTAAMGGYQFDNSNRFVGFLGQQGVTADLLERLTAQSATVAGVVEAVANFRANPLVVAVQSFLDQQLVQALAELLLTLLTTLVFAYVFFLLIRRTVSPKYLYTFWLFVTGLQFFSTGIVSAASRVLGMGFMGLPELVPAGLLWLGDSGFRILWFYLFPALILPRLFEGLTALRTVAASLLTQMVMVGLGWLFTTGLFTLYTLFGALLG